MKTQCCFSKNAIKQTSQILADLSEIDFLNKVGLMTKRMSLLTVAAIVYLVVTWQLFNFQNISQQTLLTKPLTLTAFKEIITRMSNSI